MADRLECVEIETGELPGASIIWLHGLGADGHDFEPIVTELQLAVAVRFIFPHAPVRPVTLNGGLRMRAWYDILTLDRDGPVDEAGIRTSAALVEEFIQREASRGIPAHRVILAGFSQGGAIVLHVGLRYPTPLAGVLALSSYLPLLQTLVEERSAANAALPLFMAHGTMDATVPRALGELSKQHLAELGYNVEWHTYPMSHSVCPAEINDVNLWLQKRLVAVSSP